jgi:predicted peptidase
MKNYKWLIVNVFVLIFIFLINGQQSNGQNKSNNPADKGQVPFSGKSMEMDKSNDLKLKSLMTETIDKFKQLEYEDSVTGKKMSYNLYVPQNYQSNQTFPMVLFIADGSTVNKDTKVPLTQGYGGLVWASSETQSEHPCFVLVPQFTTQTVNDKSETSYEVEMVIRLVNKIVEQYNIDKNRLYTTGQSMGGMMSMYFNIAHPDMFAASIFTSCQWDVSKMGGFAQKHFFYIVAAGDMKAPKGMAALRTVLEKEGAKISAAEWSAKLPEKEQEENVKKLLSENSKINFITFSKGTVLPEDGSGMEHMWSFDYAYKLKGVRDWLFQQKKQ